MSETVNINVRIPRGLQKEVNEIIEKTKKYSNFSDFVREAIRDKVKELRRDYNGN